MKTPIQQQIESVVNELDIHKIRMVMEFLDWEWHGIGVPTQSEIYDCALGLLERTYNEFDNTPYPYWISTGGLKASCGLADGRYVFTIDFIVAEADNYYDEDE